MLIEDLLHSYNDLLGSSKSSTRAVLLILFGVVASVITFLCLGRAAPWILHSRTWHSLWPLGPSRQVFSGQTHSSAVTQARKVGPSKFPGRADLQRPSDTRSSITFRMNLCSQSRSLSGPRLGCPSRCWQLVPSSPGLLSGTLVVHNDAVGWKSNLAVAAPFALLIAGSFFVFAQASIAECVAVGVIVWMAWMGALWVGLGATFWGGEVGIAFVLSFASLFGGALISPKLRTPGVWIVALLAVVVTSLELVLFEKFAGQLGKLAASFSTILLNLCAAAAISYGLSLPDPRTAGS